MHRLVTSIQSQPQMSQGTQNGKVFRNLEVVITWLVKFYRIFGECILSWVISFNGSPRNKAVVMQNSLMEEENHFVYNSDNDRISGSTKCWIFRSTWSSQHRLWTTLLNEWFIGCMVVNYCRGIDFTPIFMLQMWCWIKRTILGCIICLSDGLLSGSWPAKAASAVSLKVWQRKTRCI